MNHTTIVRNLAMGLTSVLFSVSAFSAKLHSSCYLQDGKGQKIQGVNSDELHEIASVSKLFTTYWAVAKLKPDFRYITTVHITPVDKANQVVDVHLEGMYDPYFGREQFQVLVTELNKLKVRKIRNLSHDERFSFLANPRTNEIAWGTILPEDPSPERITMNLRSVVTTIGNRYAETRNLAKTVHGITLPEKLSLQVTEVKYVSRADYKEETDTRTFTFKSAPLHVLLKEMNRQSNNWAAEQIFKSLGGAGKFATFIKESLNFDESDVVFVNGSGNRIDPGGPGIYNRATCDSVVTLISALKAKMESHKMKIEDVMAVAGSEPTGSVNTLGTYTNENTSDALIAKTGTVNPAITLAGVASTGSGDIFFGLIYHTEGTRADWSAARTLIRRDLNKLFKETKEEVNYQPTRFASFDDKSVLVENKPQVAPKG